MHVSKIVISVSSGAKCIFYKFKSRLRQVEFLIVGASQTCLEYALSYFTRTYMLICDCFKGLWEYHNFRRWHSIWNLKTLYVLKCDVRHRLRYEIKYSTPRINYSKGFQVRIFPFYLTISTFTSVHPYCGSSPFHHMSLHFQYLHLHLKLL